VPHTYTHTDNDLQHLNETTGITYYKLALHDHSHKETGYSKVIAVDACSGQIVPNPASDRVYIQNHTRYTHYALTNSLGQAIREHGVGTGIIALEDLAEGFYYLVLTNRNGKTEVKKLVVERK